MKSVISRTTPRPPQILLIYVSIIHSVLSLLRFNSIRFPLSME